MEIGDVVKLRQPVVQGTIIDTQYNKDQRCLEHMLEWVDADDETHQRWFVESDLEEV